MKSVSGYLSGVIIETSMHDTCKPSICKAFCGTYAGRPLAPFERRPLPGVRPELHGFDGQRSPHTLRVAAADPPARRAHVVAPTPRAGLGDGLVPGPGGRPGR